MARTLASHLCDPGLVPVVGKWVEFVVGSLLAPRLFSVSSSFLPPIKTNTSKFQFDLDLRCSRMSPWLRRMGDYSYTMMLDLIYLTLLYLTFSYLTSPYLTLPSTGRCIKHSCNKHWCDGTAIGYNNDTLYIGFSSTFRDLSAANPTVDVNFYHNETGKWQLTASETFANNEEKVVHLLGLIVHEKSSARHKRGAVGSSQWEYVKFKAKITKTADKVLYQVGAYFVHS